MFYQIEYQVTLIQKKRHMHAFQVKRFTHTHTHTQNCCLTVFRLYNITSKAYK